MDHLRKWALKSLTIGPQSNKTSLMFWTEALRDLPPLPSVDNVTIIYNYPRVNVFNTGCWDYFDRLLTRQDIFPALRVVYVYSSFGSQSQRPDRRRRVIYDCLRKVRERGMGPVSCSRLGRTIELTLLIKHRSLLEGSQ